MSKKKVEWVVSEYDLLIDGELAGWIEVAGGTFKTWEPCPVFDVDCTYHPTLEEAKAALLERVMATGGSE